MKPFRKTEAEIIAESGTPEAKAQRQRYLDAGHAMQTGVEFYDDKRDQTPKSLRVGVNSAMVEHSALAGLLMRAGVFTPLEYVTALADEMEREAQRYQRKINAQHGAGDTIKLS